MLPHFLRQMERQAGVSDLRLAATFLALSLLGLMQCYAFLQKMTKPSYVLDLGIQKGKSSTTMYVGNDCAAVFDIKLEESEELSLTVSGRHLALPTELALYGHATFNQFGQLRASTLELLVDQTPLTLTTRGVHPMEFTITESGKPPIIHALSGPVLLELIESGSYRLNFAQTMTAPKSPLREWISSTPGSTPKEKISLKQGDSECTTKRRNSSTKELVQLIRAYLYEQMELT